jgi:transcriptional regulator NrdR family protein
MTCPECGGKSKVVNTAKDVDEVVRLRRCTVCNHPFYTAERDIDPDYDSEVIARIRYGVKRSRKKRGLKEVSVRGKI